MFSKKIHTDLTMRLLHESDAEAIFQLIDKNRMFLKTGLTWIDYIQTKQHTSQFIAQRLQGYELGQSLFCLLLYRNEPCGIIALGKINHYNKIASIGYWLGEQFTGKGIITEAAKVLIHHSFTELQLNKIEIAVPTNNTHANNVPKRLQLKKEGTLRAQEQLNGVYIDHHIYGLLRSEWTK